jgi:hypothetical protein
MPDTHVPRPQAAAEAPLQGALRQALRGGAGRVALRVQPSLPHHAKVARALLMEGALAAGGQVVEGPGGDLLLVGAEAARAARLRNLLDRLLGGAATTIWSLDRDLAALRAYAAGDSEAGAPDLAGLDAWLTRVPLEGLARRRLAARLGAQVAEPVFLRIDIAAAALRRRLGALGTDADLLRHAMQRLAARLLQAMADPAQARGLIGARPAGPLHLPVPPAIMAPGGGGGGATPHRLVATLTVAELAEPAALEARRAALAARGWAVELEGIDARLLPLLMLESLPADLLRLEWSPDLAGPAAQAALRRIDPARLVLCEVDGPEALDWAQGRGLHGIEGSAVEAALAARRAA